jgi:hypothetical protein
MLLLFLLVPGQGTVCVPHGYEAWENKDKVQNGDHNDSDREYNDCIAEYHNDNNTTDKSRLWP